MVVEMSIEQNIKELQSACEEINRMYGLEVSVQAKGINDYTDAQGIGIGEYDNPTGGDGDG